MLLKDILNNFLQDKVSQVLSELDFIAQGALAASGLSGKLLKLGVGGVDGRKNAGNILDLLDEAGLLCRDSRVLVDACCGGVYLDVSTLLGGI